MGDRPERPSSAPEARRPASAQALGTAAAAGLVVAPGVQPSTLRPGAGAGGAGHGGSILAVVARGDGSGGAAHGVGSSAGGFNAGHGGGKIVLGRTTGLASRASASRGSQLGGGSGGGGGGGGIAAGVGAGGGLTASVAAPSPSGAGPHGHAHQSSTQAPGPGAGLGGAGLGPGPGLAAESSGGAWGLCAVGMSVRGSALSLASPAAAGVNPPPDGLGVYLSGVGGPEAGGETARRRKPSLPPEARAAAAAVHKPSTAPAGPSAGGPGAGRPARKSSMDGGGGSGGSGGAGVSGSTAAAARVYGLEAAPRRASVGTTGAGGGSGGGGAAGARPSSAVKRQAAAGSAGAGAGAAPGKAVGAGAAAGAAAAADAGVAKPKKIKKTAQPATGTEAGAGRAQGEKKALKASAAGAGAVPAKAAGAKGTGKGSKGSKAAVGGAGGKAVASSRGGSAKGSAGFAGSDGGAAAAAAAGGDVGLALSVIPEEGGSGAASASATGVMGSFSLAAGGGAGGGSMPPTPSAAAVAAAAAAAAAGGGGAAAAVRASAASAGGGAKKPSRPVPRELDAAQFELGRVLGSGSFATVYLARQLDAGGAKVVVKRLDRRPATATLGHNPMAPSSEVDNEVAVMTRAGFHPNLVEFRGWYRDPRDGVMCLVMGFCSGGTLAQLIKNPPAVEGGAAGGAGPGRNPYNAGGGPIADPNAFTTFGSPMPAGGGGGGGGAMGDGGTIVGGAGGGGVAAARTPFYFPEELVMFWFVQLLMALHHLHGRKIMHRDLKPDNIFLAAARRVIKLGDLGVAKHMSGTFELAITCLGTPYYMSPEVLASRPYTYASDIWSLGCVLYEMAARRTAFEAFGLPQLMFKIIRVAYDPLPPAYSRPFQQLVNGMLRADPDDRPTTGDLLAQPYVRRHLARLLTLGAPAGAPVLQGPSPSMPPMVKPSAARSAVKRLEKAAAAPPPPRRRAEAPAVARTRRWPLASCL